MKKVVYLLMAAAALLVCGCKKGNDDSGAGQGLTANFTITPAEVFAGDEVIFEAEVKGGAAPYTFKWTVGSSVLAKTTQSVSFTFPKNGSFIVTLDVSDAQGSKAQKKQAVVVNPPKVQEEGELNVEWVGMMMGYNIKSAAAVADDGSVYTTCGDNKLYKWSSSGEKLWEKLIYSKNNSASTTHGTPSVDTDGTVFIGAGNTAGYGTLKAYNPDGNVKWTFSGWWRSDGTTPEPSCIGPIAAIDANNIYFGCTGNNGIVFAADKSNGNRKGFLAPTGGARSGIVISKEGLIHWYGGKYGVFGMSMAALNAGGDNKLSETWRTFGGGSTDEEKNKVATSTYEGQIACTKVDGVNCVAGIVTDAVGTKVYAVKASDGSEVSVTYISDTNLQDQGGVVIDKDGNIVASLNNTNGQSNGGIVIVNPSTQAEVARYRIAEKVSGSPAVDAAGNIHFGTESGFYYIVKPSGSSCSMVVKRNLADLILADDRYKDSFSDLNGASKIWCSPVIGDDGKIYICFTESVSRAFGGVACLSYEGCTGPADSEWPMIGQNRRHTCSQK